MILTGDVNLMNVTDPRAPFALLIDECAKPTWCSAISNAVWSKRRRGIRSAMKVSSRTQRSGAKR
jgi:hypothetical protein